MTWNTDMSAAPKGTETVVVVGRTKDGKDISRTVRKEEWLWLVSEAGEVFRGHWSPIRKAWAGAGDKEKVIAWQPFVKPTWPA